MRWLYLYCMATMMSIKFIKQRISDSRRDSFSICRFLSKKRAHASWSQKKYVKGFFNSEWYQNWWWKIGNFAPGTIWMMFNLDKKHPFIFCLSYQSQANLRFSDYCGKSNRCPWHHCSVAYQLLIAIVRMRGVDRCPVLLAPLYRFKKWIICEFDQWHNGNSTL